MRFSRCLKIASGFAIAVLSLGTLVVPASGRIENPETEGAHHSDDCHTDFSVYLAAQPYIINPTASRRARTKILAVIENLAAGRSGAVPYRLSITEAATGRVVYTTEAGGDLAKGGSMESQFTWSGVDNDGRPVHDGEYVISVDAHFFEGEFFSPELIAGKTGDTTALDAAPTSAGSPISVIVDRAGRYDQLFAFKGADKPSRPGETGQRPSIDPTFAYQYFYGTTHAHTNWSDGGMPATSSCTSGRYGYAGGAQPVDAFNYARTQGSIDFLAVVEHNHLMNDACSGCTDQAVKDRYTAGFQAAQTATVPGTFVGLFGMEWGVIGSSSTKQGHLNIYNQSQLINWTGEPGHVFVPDKTSNSYDDLYTAVRNNQGSYGSYATFNHPSTNDYNVWQRTADGDAVMRGIAMISGPAFSTSTTFAPGGSTYVSMYNKALSLGWKIAPEAHQDNHCWNFGNSTPNRTVAVIPNGTVFDQQSLVAAYGARHFYAAQDRDVQLAYKTSDNARIMGDAFAASTGVPVSVRLSDPASEGVQKIEIWGGRAGSNASPGAAPAIVASNTSSATLTATLAPKTAGEEWYYYVVAVQADGDTVWSAPMWITWGGGGCTLPGTPALSSPAAGATNVATSTTLSWGAVTGATSYDISFGNATTPPFYQNVTGTSVAVSGLSNNTTYGWTVTAKNACGSGTAPTVRTFATEAGGGPGSTPIACAGSAGGTLASTDGRSTVRTTSYADLYTFTATAGQQVTITDNSTAFDAYLVLKSPSGTVVAQDDDGNGGTNSKIVYTPTLSGTYTIEATSYTANATGAYTVALSCATGGGTPVTLLSEGAESGASGWTFTKNTGSGWSIETSDAHSGTKRFKTNVGFATYLNGADWSVVSPVFSLSGRSSATLKYWTKYKTESGYDFLKVEVSTNGGTSWTQLSSVSGTSSGYSAWAPQVTVNLTPYVGNANCKIRFRFTSDTSQQDWGVAVDDILITAQ